MIPFAKDTVTLFHRENGIWTRHVLTGCSYRRTARRAMTDNSITASNDVTCRIPAPNIMPAAGDMIALGNVPDMPENEVAVVRLLEKQRATGAFRVQSVSDNARPGMPVPHYAARGE